MGEITGMEDVVTAGGEAAVAAGNAEAIPVGPVNSIGPVEPADRADSAGPLGPAALVGPTGPTGPTGPADLVGPADPADPMDLVGLVAPVRVDRDRREGPADDEGAWWRYLTWPICEAGGSSPAS